VIFLRTDSTSDGGQDVVFANFGGGGEEFAGDDQLNKFTDIDAHGAFVRAGGLRAFEAAQGLLPCEFGGISQVDFGEVMGAHLGKLLRHVLARDFHAFFQRQRVQGWALGSRHCRPPLGTQDGPGVMHPDSNCCWNSAIDFFSASRYMALR